jgi:hypothetical protein
MWMAGLRRVSEVVENLRFGSKADIKSTAMRLLYDCVALTAASKSSIDVQRVKG